MNTRIIVILSAVFLLGSCDLETGDPPYNPVINFSASVILSSPIYISHRHTVFDPYSWRKVVQQSGWIGYIYDEQNLNYENSLKLIDAFMIKMYSTDVTNLTNWTEWYQDNLSYDDCEPYVFYSNMITNGLSRPDLFQATNSFPFYVSSTNSPIDIKITITKLQTNIIH